MTSRAPVPSQTHVLTPAHGLETSALRNTEPEVPAARPAPLSKLRVRRRRGRGALAPLRRRRRRCQQTQNARRGRGQRRERAPAPHRAPHRRAVEALRCAARDCLDTWRAAVELAVFAGVAPAAAGDRFYSARSGGARSGAWGDCAATCGPVREGNCGCSPVACVVGRVLRAVALLLSVS